MAYASKPRANAMRITARIAAFMPGASPPLVSTARRFDELVIPAIAVVRSRWKSPMQIRHRREIGKHRTNPVGGKFSNRMAQSLLPPTRHLQEVVFGIAAFNKMETVARI